MTSNTCEDCHATAAWSPARFDHASVTAACFTCHNGSTATGKNATHIQSANTCEDCHTSAAWTPARFDHAAVTGACFSCHNGSTATGKTPMHIQSANTCEDCHSTLAWLPARFDHASITGSCSSCHNGTRATGKPGNHFITSLDCVECHATTRWSPATFTHTSANYPSGHRQTNSCSDCHIGNSQANAWRNPSFRPDCAGCHANDFRADAHKKVDSPRILYTVSELRDCTGACHMYADSSLTRIIESRTGEHSASRGGW
jgi:hypothetical protein